MPIQLNDDIYELFRRSRNQTLISSDSDVQAKIGSKKNKNNYLKFLDKYNDLENEVDTLNCMDFIYYFRETASQIGIKYVISNLQRDMSVFKKAQDNYSNKELCLMIEFLFLSEQDYLRKDTLSPTVLVSTWCNTIYADSQLWSEDKYIPRRKKTVNNKLKPTREWTGSKEKSAIGKWRK